MRCRASPTWLKVLQSASAPISHPLGTISIFLFAGAFDDGTSNAVARIPCRLTSVVVRFRVNDKSCATATDQRTLALQERDSCIERVETQFAVCANKLVRHVAFMRAVLDLEAMFALLECVMAARRLEPVGRIAASGLVDMKRMLSRREARQVGID
jgi:hypothetical protein